MGGKEAGRGELHPIQRKARKEGGREGGKNTYLRKGSRELETTDVLIRPSQGKRRTTHSAACEGGREGGREEGLEMSWKTKK